MKVTADAKVLDYLKSRLNSEENKAVRFEVKGFG